MYLYMNRANLCMLLGIRSFCSIHVEQFYRQPLGHEKGGYLSNLNCQRGLSCIGLMVVFQHKRTRWVFSVWSFMYNHETKFVFPTYTILIYITFSYKDGLRTKNKTKTKTNTKTKTKTKTKQKQNLTW